MNDELLNLRFDLCRVWLDVGLRDTMPPRKVDSNFLNLVKKYLQLIIRLIQALCTARLEKGGHRGFQEYPREAMQILLERFGIEGLLIMSELGFDVASSVSDNFGSVCYSLQVLRDCMGAIFLLG